VASGRRKNGKKIAQLRTMRIDSTIKCLLEASNSVIGGLTLFVFIDKNSVFISPSRVVIEFP